MSEAEWLASHDIEQMLECLVTVKYPDAEPGNWKGGQRKKRLFLCACGSRIWNHVPMEYREVFKSLDPDACGSDGNEVAWTDAERISWEHSNLLFAIGYDDLGLFCYIAAKIVARATKKGTDTLMEARQQANLLRDIFGTPFRLVRLDPAWRTSKVTTLAQTIYADRAFDKMPALADALQEAGCDNADIISHCRGPGPHVKGCWVVDLVLGKE